MSHHFEIQTELTSMRLRNEPQKSLIKLMGDLTITQGIGVGLTISIDVGDAYIMNGHPDRNEPNFRTVAFLTDRTEPQNRTVFF